MSSLKRTTKDLQRKIELAGESVVMTGTVTAVDPVAQTCTVAVDAGTSVQSWPNLPLLGNYLPTVGHDVTILLGGDAPIVMPPTADVVTGIRGRVDSTVGDNLALNDFEMFTELCFNGSFETTVDGWVGTNATLAQSGAQAAVGTKSMSLTATAGSVTMTAEQPLDGRVMASVAQSRWYQYVVQARTAVTGRAITTIVKFYDDALNLLSTVTQAFGGDTSGSWTIYTKYMAAPVGAAWARLSVTVGASNVANAEVHYLDAISFTEAVVDFDPTTSATVYTFDSSSESFTGTGATVAQDAGANPAAISGAGSLKVTATGNAAYSVNSPTGTSGVATVPTLKVSLSCWVWCDSTERTFTPTIKWWNGASANGTAVGAAVDGVLGQWVEIAMNAVAPPSSTNVSVTITTSGGVTGESFHIDSVLLTKANNTLVTRNTNATYVRTGTASMSMKIITNGVANVLTPPGDDATYAWPVIPHDFYAVNCYYKNDAGNGTRRAVVLVASWYSSSGTFIGTTVGTYPVTTPGTGWVPARERFEVPDNAAFMRANIVWLGVANDIVYIDDFEVRQVSHLTGKLTPETSIDNVDVKYQSTQGTVLSGLAANTWFATGQQTIKNPNMPVRVSVLAIGQFYITANTNNQARVGISFDNGLSWSYGPAVLQTCEALLGFPSDYPWMAAHQLTGTPTDKILYRVELQASGNVVTDVKAVSQQAWIVPAPPAGQQT